MKAFAYFAQATPAHPGPEGCQQEVTKLPVPDVSAYQSQFPTVVRIKVVAASLNPIDFKRRDGWMKPIIPEKAFPVIVGYDASGIVDQVGPQVSKFKVGDEVYFCIDREFPAFGTCAEYTLTVERLVALKPKNMSHEEAAGVPLAALTALQLLQKAGVKAGDKVLINTAAGGVGHYAVQIAKAMGASHVTGTSSAAKHPFLKSIGCDETVDYKTQDFTQMYKDRPFDVGVDLAREAIRMCKVVKEKGWVVSGTEGMNGKLLTAAGIQVNMVIRLVLYYRRWSLEGAIKAAKVNFSGLYMVTNGKDLALLTGYIEAGKVKTVLEGTYGIDRAPDAMRTLEGGRVTGKVVVKLS